MISIIVPIYKVEKFIIQCVDSILNQSYKDLEIILVDDGSPDNCPNICDEYANMDSRIKVVHKSNGGLMSARQAGLRVATGDYIGFVDGDDWIEPDMYERFANAIEKYCPDIAICEFIYAYPDKDELSIQNLPWPYYDKAQLETEIYPQMLFKDEFYRFGINPCCWSKVYKKDILEKNLFNVTTEIKMGEDAAFTYPCLLDADSLAYIHKPLYHYRNNPESMTNMYDSDLENTILIPYGILKNVFDKFDYELASQLNYYLLYLVNFAVRNEANPSCKKSRKEIIKTLKKFTSNENVVLAAKSVDFAKLPIHTKLVARLLAKGNASMIYLYTLLFRRFLKWKSR